MRKFKGTPGNWSVGLAAVVSDTPNPVMEKSETGHSDIEYYGGYLIAESILAKADAEVIADAPIMLDTIIEMRNEITAIMLQFGQYIQVKDYNRITRLLNKSEGIISKHTEEDKLNL